MRYSLFRTVALNGPGFSRPFRLVRVESLPGYGLAERIRTVVNKKKILGASRWMILDHVYNTTQLLGFPLGGWWHGWRAARNRFRRQPERLELEPE